MKYSIEKRTAHVKSSGTETWSKWFPVDRRFSFDTQLKCLTTLTYFKELAIKNKVDQFKVEYRAIMKHI